MPVADPEVTQIRIDHGRTLLLGDGTEVRIEQPFRLSRLGREPVWVPPGDVAYEAAEALPLLFQIVEVLRATQGGELVIDFQSGDGIVVPVNPHYEGWQVTRPDGELWVGLPGGGLGHFEAS